ncbi:hypothetical protein Tco_0065442 [Tanacetum coccineum]
MYGKSMILRLPTVHGLPLLNRHGNGQDGKPGLLGRDHVVYSLGETRWSIRHFETYGKKGFGQRFLLTLRKKWGTIQGYDTIVVKWKHSIRPKIVAFIVVYDSVQRMDESGSSNIALFQKSISEI